MHRMLKLSLDVLAKKLRYVGAALKCGDLILLVFTCTQRTDYRPGKHHGRQVVQPLPQLHSLFDRFIKSDTMPMNKNKGRPSLQSLPEFGG